MFAAPVIFLGLTLRLIFDYVSRSGEQTFRDYFFMGLWEGVLWCIVKSHDLAIPVALGIAAKELFFTTLVPSALSSITSVLGIVVGAVCSDIISGIIDEPNTSSSSKGHHHSSSRNSRRKSTKTPHSNDKFRPPRRTVSDITSVDSESELVGPKAAMSPLEREIAALRARASLADSERRRFKEEKKWAVADGNVELAKQLKWQAQKYSALMKSFHREADQKLLEAARGGSSSRTRLQTIEEQNDTTQNNSPTTSQPAAKPTSSGRVRKSSRNTGHPVDSFQLKSAIKHSRS